MNKQFLYASLFLTIYAMAFLGGATYLSKNLKIPFSPECGNGICEPEENPESCTSDCKSDSERDLQESSCGDENCSMDETRYTCPLDCSWPSFNKKIAAIHDGQGATTVTNESRLNHYLSLGINTIISHSNGELRIAYFNFSKYNETYMPPVLTNYSKFSKSKNYTYFPFVAWTFNATKPTPNGAIFEKAVLEDGTELEETSPWSEDYWNNYTELLVRLAKYAKTENVNINGLLFDFELYVVGGGIYPNYSWGYENSTWRGFLQEIGIIDDSILNLPYNERKIWLDQKDLSNNFRNYLHNLMYTRAKNMKDRVAAVNPDFLIGAYPSPISVWHRRFIDDIHAGWSSPNSPTVILATDSYMGGGINNVPKTINQSVLMYNKYFNLTTTYKKPIYGYYIAGLIISSDWYSSEKFYNRVTPMANVTNGYWIWKGETIRMPCQQAISPNSYGERLPLNCANDNRDPGCCINNRNLEDTNWITECCPYYEQTVNELFQAINATNLALNPLPPPPAPQSINTPPETNNNNNPGNNPGDPSNPPPCLPNWICSEWRPCISNIQTRECIDQNSCDNLANKPQTIRICDSSQLIINPIEEENPTNNNPFKKIYLPLKRYFIYGLLGTTIILMIILTLIIRNSLFQLEQKEREVIQIARSSLN